MRWLLLLPILFLGCDVRASQVTCYRADICSVWGSIHGYCLFERYENKSESLVAKFYAQDALINYVQSKDLGGKLCE